MNLLSCLWVGSGGLQLGCEGQESSAAGGWMTFGDAMEKVVLCVLAVRTELLLRAASVMYPSVGVFQ